MTQQPNRIWLLDFSFGEVREMVGEGRGGEGGVVYIVFVSATNFSFVSTTAVVCLSNEGKTFTLSYDIL